MYVSLFWDIASICFLFLQLEPTLITLSEAGLVTAALIDIRRSLQKTNWHFPAFCQAPIQALGMRVVCSKQNTLRKIQSDKLGLLSTSCQCNVWFSRDLSCSIQIRVFCVLSSLFVGIFSDKLNRCCKGCYCSTRKLHRWLIWSENSFHYVECCMEEGFLSNTKMNDELMSSRVPKKHD